MLPKRLGRKTIHRSPWVNLHVDQVEMPSGKIIEEYHFIDFPQEGVMTLFNNKKGEICFVKVYRYHTQKLSWELPAGSIEEGEEPIEAAAREPLEESGYEVVNLRKIYSYNTLNGTSNGKIHTFFGELKNGTQVAFDENEVKEVAWFSVEKVKAMIRSQEITDGETLTALLLYVNEDQLS